MIYIADTDLVLDGILNRSETSPDSVNFWRQIEHTSKKICITNIGFKRIYTVIESLISNPENLNSTVENITSYFTVIKVNSSMLHKARKLDIKDFESAIELVCAEEYSADAIITDRKEAFKYLEENNRYHTIQCIEPSDFTDHSKPFYSKIEIQNLFSNSFRHEGNIKSQSLLRPIYTKDNKSHLPYPGTLQIDYPEKVIKHVAKRQFTPSIKKYSHVKNLYTQRLAVLKNHTKISQRYGGIDWGYYSSKYDVIEANWENLQEVLGYYSKCAIYSKKHYRRLVSLWNDLNRFSDLYSHYEERKKWLTIIAELSQHYEQWDDYFCALTRKAWILVMQYKFEEAEEALHFASKKQEYLKNSFIVNPYLHCSFTLNIRKNKLDQARKILDLQIISISGLDGKVDNCTYKREFVNFRADAAKLLFKEVINRTSDKTLSDRDKEDLKMSLDFYTTCLETSKSIDWQRGVCYFLNKIADIKLVLALHSEGRLKQQLICESEGLLRDAIKIAIINNNQRRLASLKASLAEVATQQNRPKEAKLEAISAVKIFKKIGEGKKAKECQDRYLTGII